MEKVNSLSSRERYSEEINRIVDDMSLLDDDLMARVFENNIPATELLLQTILNMDLSVKESIGQMEFKSPVIDGRNIRLDIYAIDSNGRQFNCEVQRRNSGADPKRVRYHSSMMDTRALQASELFAEIKDTYVIFITEKDYYNKGKPLYKVDRTVCFDDKEEPFSDGSHIVYVNGSYKGNDPLGLLMADFRNTTVDGFNNPILEKGVKHFKIDEGGRNIMCDAVEKYAKEIGRQEREEERILSIKNIMKKLQYTAEQAMELLEIPVSERSKYLSML